MYKIEILLATYNGEKYLEEQLQSILNQSNQDWYLTIRDDGSTDGTINIINDYINKYPAKIKLFEDKRSRLGSTLSFASLIEQSSGNYLMLCDQDDFWLPDKINSTYSMMLDKERLFNDLPLMVFTDMNVVDKHLNILAESFIENQKLFTAVVKNFHMILALNVVAGCTTMINRKAVEYILPIKSRNIIHDQWIAVNIAKYGKIFYLNEKTSLYRQHGNNAVGTDGKTIKYFIKKFQDPLKQLRIYYDLIKGLDFKVNVFIFLYYKSLFTIMRLFNLKYD